MMKRTLAVAAFMLAPSAHAQTPPTVAQAVAQVDAFYKQVSTYRAAFTQQYAAHAYNTTKTETGTMMLGRPSQIAFVYAYGNRVTGSGPTFTFFDATTNQTLTQTVAQSSYGPLGFLAGQTSLAQTFTFRMQPFTNGYRLIGTPITPTPQYTVAIFDVDGPTSQVRRVTLVDGQHNVNRFEFSSVTIVPARP